MKLKITKRDVKFFFLGVLTLFLIDLNRLIWNLELLHHPFLRKEFPKTFGQ